MKSYFKTSTKFEKSKIGSNTLAKIFFFNAYLGNLFFHSVSKLNRWALKASACCSTVSRTIFQKQSETAKLKFLVVKRLDFTTVPL